MLGRTADKAKTPGLIWYQCSKNECRDSISVRDQRWRNLRATEIKNRTKTVADWWGTDAADHPAAVRGYCSICAGIFQGGWGAAAERDHAIKASRVILIVIWCIWYRCLDHLKRNKVFYGKSREIWSYRSFLCFFVQKYIRELCVYATCLWARWIGREKLWMTDHKSVF